MDTQLATLYDAASAAGVRLDGALTESVGAWFRRRSLCAFSADHRGCVAAAYQERTGVVQALLATRTGAQPLALQCGANHWRGRYVRTAAGLDLLVLANDTGQAVGVSLAAPAGPDWRPFLSHDSARGGRDLTLTHGDERHSCALSTALSALPEVALRQRVDAIDDLTDAARAARDRQDLEPAAFASILRWLRSQEQTVHAEVGLRTFTDPATANYWHRGRLKFPTLVEQELARLPPPPR